MLQVYNKTVRCLTFYNDVGLVTHETQTDIFFNHNSG